MPTIRALRRSRGMTFSELALASGIPVRTLAEIEYGMQTLDARTRQQLARVFELAPDHLRATAATQPANQDLQQIVAVALTSLVGVATIMPLLQGGGDGSVSSILQNMLNSAGGAQPAGVIALPSATPTEQPTAEPTVQPTNTPTVTPTPTDLPPTVTPAPTATPAFTLAADGPHGCPLIAPTGARIVITQGFGVGTHSPANTMGAVDLAVDTNGDGYGEPDTTYGTQIVATHAGTAHIFPDSWPGGNFVIITNAETGYATAYGHLSSFAIVDGQTIEAGTSIGTVGTTGMSTGPHLHYEVRTVAGNIDPAPLLTCS